MRLRQAAVIAAVLAVCCSRSDRSTPAAAGAPANATLSRVSLAAGSVPADGVTPAAVNVTVRDDAGKAISGAQVALSYTGKATIVAPAVVTDAGGNAAFKLTATEPTAGVITATVTSSAAVQLAASPSLDFHGCSSGQFVNGACVPPPFLLFPPAIETSWAGVNPREFGSPRTGTTAAVTSTRSRTCSRLRRTRMASPLRT